MSDKPNVLDWHRTAAEQIMDYDGGDCPGDVAECAYVIAAHDPHNETVYVPMYDDIHLAPEDALGAEVTKLTAERDEARHLFESTDLHRGRLFSENNKLKAEVERLRKALKGLVDGINHNCDADEWYRLQQIAAAALEEKEKA